MSTTACVVLITGPDRARAETLARALVEEKLAACVSLVPQVRSIYRWQGAIEEADEVLCLVKTTRERFEALRARVIALHPYEVPEVIALDVAAGHPPYLDWLAASLR